MLPHHHQIESWRIYVLLYFLCGMNLILSPNLLVLVWRNMVMPMFIFPNFRLNTNTGTHLQWWNRFKIKFMLKHTIVLVVSTSTDDAFVENTPGRILSTRGLVCCCSHWLIYSDHDCFFCFFLNSLYGIFGNREEIDR